MLQLFTIVGGVTTLCSGVFTVGAWYLQAITGEPYFDEDMGRILNWAVFFGFLIGIGATIVVVNAGELG